MKLRLPQRRLFRAAIYFVSLLLVLIAIDLAMVRIRRTIHPGYSTTRIIKPTMPDGSIDYLSAIESYFSRGVTPQNNAAIAILQALGPAAISKTQPRDGITDRLGMPHLADEGSYYITYEQFFKQHPTPGVDPAGRLDGTITVRPELAPWIEANQKPLALFTEASKRSEYFIPFNGGNRPSSLVSILLPQVGLLNDARWALLTRALMRLNGGDVSGFQEDIHTAHSLARLFGKDATIVGRLVGVSLERSTCHLERFSSFSGKLTPQQMRDMIADLQSLGEQPGMNDCIDYGERFMGLDLMQVLARSNAKELTEMINGIQGRSQPEILFDFLPVPYDECMRDLNHFYDGQIVAMRQPTYAKRVDAWKLLEQELPDYESTGSISQFFTAKWPAQLLIPELINCMTKVESVRMEGSLTQLALALAVFRSEHGTYPLTLTELAPAELPAVPQDLFSDQPLIYSRTTSDYNLYSVGPNIKDDGGKGNQPVDDIAVSEALRSLGQ